MQRFSHVLAEHSSMKLWIFSCKRFPNRRYLTYEQKILEFRKIVISEFGPKIDQRTLF